VLGDPPSLSLGKDALQAGKTRAAYNFNHGAARALSSLREQTAHGRTTSSSYRKVFR
jgi:hypothetical protein